ncbi:hypothetical protein [Paludifilum halophilum]|uniref:YjzC family protein n=1 Tax=Paludifilum halophilum TaxID=1642702 RepID=A0A235B4D9_9BACL|nr:hypothetical protein [Paludifilum halophilum]OYD06485.1 hypothetical protein CHM34_16480 [Paludifilum halophilum]
MADRQREFRTGERVTEPGEYVCTAGNRKRYEGEETFDACPVSGEETTWRLADDTETGCC